jgi:hypothetical protein
MPFTSLQDHSCIVWRMNWMRALPRAAVDAVTAETRGEIVKWAGQPSPRGAFWRTTPIWLMGIPWTALMGAIVFVLVAAVWSGRPTDRVVTTWEFGIMAAMLVFVAAFVLIGLGMLAAPFWVWWKSRRMVYVLTDRRLVRIGYGARREVVSYNPALFVAIDRRQGKAGTGTLTITTRVYKDSDGDSVNDTEMLVGVPDAATADRLMRAMMANSPERQS